MRKAISQILKACSEQPTNQRAQFLVQICDDEIGDDGMLDIGVSTAGGWDDVCVVRVPANHLRILN